MITGHPAYDRDPYEPSSISSSLSTSSTRPITSSISSATTSSSVTDASDSTTPTTASATSDAASTDIIDSSAGVLIPYESHVTLLGDAAHPMSPFKGQGMYTLLLCMCIVYGTLFIIFMLYCIYHVNILR